MNDSPYQAPEASLNQDEKEPENKRYLTRKMYFGSLILVWIIIPLLATFIARAAGLDQGGVTSTSVNGNYSYNLDMLYAWYISVPLFVWFTYRRVKDTGLNPLFTLVFILPLVNLIIWFWPPKRRNL